MLLAAVLAYALPNSSIGRVVTFATWIAGLIVAIRLARTGVGKLIWRLRNRLIVAYAFIAMVPIALILARWCWSAPTGLPARSPSPPQCGVPVGAVFARWNRPNRQTESV